MAYEMTNYAYTLDSVCAHMADADEVAALKKENFKNEDFSILPVAEWIKEAVEYIIENGEVDPKSCQNISSMLVDVFEQMHSE